MNANKRQVLILEDEPKTLSLLVDYLRSPLIELVACTEIEAAECLMDRRNFDILVTDLEVSKLGGLEGIRLIRHVTCHFPKTTIIVFSGNISPEVRALGTALGVTQMLEKPSGLKHLRGLIDSGLPIRRDSADPKSGKVSYVAELEEVLRDRSISAMLQPIVAFDSETSSPRVFGVEGLARGPEGSLLRSPEILLDYASRKELLFETEMQCIEAVLIEGRHFNQAVKLFINIRTRSLSQPSFVASLRNLVLRHGYQEKDIILELTEQQSILNLEAFDQTLQKLRGLGFGLALDDYGSGFANLHLVQQLHLDYLKIDGLFCDGIQDDERKQEIVRSTFGMAKELGITAIMERVENAVELDTIRDLGATYAQGYHFSRPVPGRDLAATFQPVAEIRTASTLLEEDNEEAPSLSPPDRRVEHELANVITSIALFAHQGMKRLEAENPVREDLRRICAASEEAIELTQQLPADREPIEWPPAEAENDGTEALVSSP